MMVIVGLVILIVTVLVGVVGVFGNGGSDHALTGIAGLGLLPADTRRGRAARWGTRSHPPGRSTQPTQAPPVSHPVHPAPSPDREPAPGTIAGQGTGNQPTPRPRSLGKLFGRTPAARSLTGRGPGTLPYRHAAPVGLDAWLGPLGSTFPSTTLSTSRGADR